MLPLRELAQQAPHRTAGPAVLRPSSAMDAARQWQRLGLRTLQRANAARERAGGRATDAGRNSVAATLRQAVQMYRRRCDYAASC